MTNIITTTLAQRLYVNGNSASVIQTSLGVSLTAGVYSFDFSLGNNFNVTLTDTSIIGIPLNAQTGQSGIIFLTQDTLGNRTASFNTVWNFANGNIPVLSVAAGTVDGLVYIVRSGGVTPIISCNLISDI